MKITQLLPALLVPALLATTAAPAMAQKPVSIQTELFNAIRNCMTASSDSRSPVRVLGDCEAVTTELDRIRTARGNASQADINLYLYLKAFSYTTIGRMRLQLDSNTRTQRVCDAIEASWANVEAMIISASPVDDQARFNETRESVSGAVRQCRAERGAPPGAPPLPN